MSTFSFIRNLLFQHLTAYMSPVTSPWFFTGALFLHWYWFHSTILAYMSSVTPPWSLSPYKLTPSICTKKKLGFIPTLLSLSLSFSLYSPVRRRNMSKSPEEEHPRKAFGWAARDASGILSPFNFSRRFVLC